MRSSPPSDTDPVSAVTGQDGLSRVYIGDARARLLVVDDDDDVARFIAMNLTFEGFDVSVAHNAADARAVIREHRPELALLDVMMPGVDGVELCRQLRADPMTASIAIIMVTARGLSADKVVGLTAGADDYIIKPFDTLELVARVRSALRRNRDMRDVSPLTGLPGNSRIMAEIAARVTNKRHGGADFAVCYVDLDNFKAVNDAYGFVRGDQLISALAQALVRAIGEEERPSPFLGHLGGDDFVLLCHPRQVEQITHSVIADFEQHSLELYDVEDVEEGCLRVINRRGEEQHFALPAVSIGVATSVRRDFTDYREVALVASQMKQVAKRTPGSFIAVDRRSADDGPAEHTHRPLRSDRHSCNRAEPDAS